MNSKIVIIGSTGVLGNKLLTYLIKNNKRVDLLTCYSNQKKLFAQKKLSKARYALVLNTKIKNSVKELYYGDHILIEYIKINPISIFYILNTGFESLKYIDLLIKFQKKCTIAVANKEILVAGGKLLINNILNSGNNFLPLDSEHYSLINHLPERNFINNYISKIYLTASGGPFYFKKKFNIKDINLKMATNHPIWKMGFKNSIDSSNLVNKVLECFELSSLYNFPLSKIGITISPKAFAHSIVFYKDHRISINCFLNDMMIPMTSPFVDNSYYNAPNNNLSIFSDKNFNFTEFNNKKFQILKFYKRILTFNHVQQINFMILNGEAVDRFIHNKMNYKDIIPFIFNNIDHFPKRKIFKNLYQIINYTNKVSSGINKL
jgi:1-deoxy-D-xylulose-5-phosphate reductoisomerase